jgi:DNA topoisomerase-1
MNGSATRIEEEAIARFGLRRIATNELAIARRAKRGRFVFLDAAGKPIGPRQARRLHDLAIPPAWKDVRIAADPAAHLQAIGRDAAGRLQYIYHAAWDDVRSATKTHRLSRLGRSLPAMRAAIDRDLDDEGTAALAAAARLIDLLSLRVGHESYAGEESGRGVATLLKRHLEFTDNGFRLRFRGKGGKLIDKSCDDAKLAAVLAALKQVRGARLFKLRSGDGWRAMTAADVNHYLGAIAARPVTAKDFRTFHASARALELLAAEAEWKSGAQCRRAIMAAARAVAADLANTPAIARSSYIHPAILEKFAQHGFADEGPARVRQGLTPAESRLVRFLENTAANGKS